MRAAHRHVPKRTQRVALAAVAAAVAACGRTVPDGTPASPAGTPPPAAAVASAGSARALASAVPRANAPAPKPACAVLADEEKALKGLKLPKAGQRGPCAPHPGGAWAVTVRASPKDAKGALLELTHLADDGTRVAAPFLDNQMGAVPLAKDDAPNCSYCDFGQSRILLKSTYDFDHDGVPEAWVQQIPDDSFAVEGDALFTLRAGKIAPYAPADGVSAFELQDVDHDGIPDLVYRQQLGGGYDAGCGAPVRATYSPPLVAHAKADGTFSFDDDEAKKAARAACPAPPAQPGKLKALVDVFCARVWGVPTKSLQHLQRAKDACLRAHRTPGKPGEGCTPVGKSACPEESDLGDLASFQPRLTLTVP